MRMRFFHRVWPALAGTLLAASCTLPFRHLPGIGLEIVAPGDGAVIPLGATLNVIGGVYKSDDSPISGEASRLIFFANGEVIGEDAPDSSSGYAEIEWSPMEVGEYMLQVQAEFDRRSAFSEAVRICVIGIDITQGYASQGYTGPCEIPARVASVEAGAIEMYVTASPESLFFNRFPLPPPLCSYDRPTLSFSAMVTDPPDDVVFVTVRYSVGDSGRGAGGRLVEQLVLDFSPLPRPEEAYNGTVDLQDFLFNSFADPSELTWTARAFGRAGEVLAEVGPQIVPITTVLGGCGDSSGPATSTPVPTSSPTPASDADCPPGTYFASDRCYPIQIVTPKPDVEEPPPTFCPNC